MDYSTMFLILVVTSYLFYRRRNSSKKLPPGPFSLPIVGHYFHLGNAPYIALSNLAKIYGPLMRIKLGSGETIVASSPEMAREILMKHDHICADRIPFYAMEALDHHRVSVGSLPIGSKWSMLRRVCREHIFANSRLEATEAHRQEKLRQLRDYLENCSRRGAAVDIGEAVTVTNLNLLSNTIFSTDFAAYGSAGAQEVRKTVSAFVRAVGTPNPADNFPILKWFDPKGLRKKVAGCYEELLRVFDEIIRKRMEERGARESYLKKVDLLEALLDFNEKNDELTMTDIKHLLLDLFFGGGDSTSVLIQWVMAELLHDPKKMSKTQAELRSVLGADEKRQAVESDIPKLPYLSAMIKETLRFRPGAPLLTPHIAREDVEINGYTIPKGATILVNVWAITRDPNVWPNPNSFEPERFLGNNIDYIGHNFELIPFGSGRRTCPGMPLVHLTSHMLIAHMIHSFDWKVKELDVNEKEGFFLLKSTPVMAIPIMKNYGSPCK